MTDGSNALVDAVLWTERLLVGQVAFIAATIAVAGIGLMMLRGYASTRRGGVTVLGCFLVFGASAISQGLMKTEHHKADGGQWSTPTLRAVQYAPDGSSDYADPYEIGDR